MYFLLGLTLAVLLRTASAQNSPSSRYQAAQDARNDPCQVCSSWCMCAGQGTEATAAFTSGCVSVQQAAVTGGLFFNMQACQLCREKTRYDVGLGPKCAACASIKTKQENCFECVQNNSLGTIPGAYNQYCNTVLLKHCWAFRHPMQFRSQLYANVPSSLPYGADG